ncbi:MAG: DNA methyltransferase [Treponema sp.]|nr:DNA methyltransferase [Treponema sp.]
MTLIEQQKAAREFAEEWKDKGDEKQHSQKFWISLLRDVLGVEKPEKYIDFEKKVKIQNTKYIDGYIPQTRVAIEQKGSKIDLDKKILQGDKTELTPYEQAKRYDNNLKYDEKCRWIVVSNFKEFRIYDLGIEEPEKHYETILLKDLEREYYRLQFLVDQKNENTRKEEELSVRAGELVGKLYDSLIKEYKNPDEKSFRSLNILCVRIVFCLYAEDAGLFGTRTAFEDYIKNIPTKLLRDCIRKLFKWLDTEEKRRDEYDKTSLKDFPYVNGGLFRDEDIDIPNFTEEIVDVIVNHCAPFNWNEISPTIFGAVFESTLGTKMRRANGMHYTSVENIHKVIDPLFMDDLNAEFKKICKITELSKRNLKLHEFQKKLGSLKFLDPACGSGNFLTETYLGLRRLENEAIKLRFGGQALMGEFLNPIEVNVNQFYGIEINDFAVTVAKTALWIAESQMMAETEKIVNQNIDFLPLTNNANIVEGNALRLDWATLKSVDKNAVPNEGLFAGFATEIDGSRHEYDYIIGNPPFVGARIMTAAQKDDVINVFGKIKNVGNLDYVSCWYKIAADYMKNSKTKTALVSTNSITQGEQVAILWKTLFENYNINIDFAWRTFRWDSESSDMAHVHCVIIGFSCQNEAKKKILFDENGNKQEAKNINGYLLDAPNMFVENRQKPLADVPEMGIGNKPIDGGNYLFTEDEMKAFIKIEPASEKYFRRWVGADEFLYGYYRYCLWLGDCSPTEIKKMPECFKRVQAVREARLASKSPGTQKLADKPTRFHVENMPTKNYIVIPEISSEKRNYVPIGFMPPEVMCSNRVKISQNASVYHFGILTSCVHMAWMRAVCGRLETRYCYSIGVVYNNFPWPNPTDEQKSKIEKTAQAILDARSKYPDSSLADMYGADMYLFPELRKAHEANDKAVIQAYGFRQNLEESEIVAELFKIYEELTKKASA